MIWSKKIKHKWILWNEITFRYKLNPIDIDYKRRGQFGREQKMLRKKDQIYKPTQYNSKHYTTYKLRDNIK